MNDKKIKTVVLPLTGFKQIRTTQFSENQVVGGLGNEGLNLAEWIQDRINDETITLPSSILGTNLGNQVDVSGRLIVTSSTGLDVIMTQATTINDGVMSKTDKINQNALITLSGMSAGSVSLNTFTGTIIPDNSTIKQALQALETSLGSVSGVTTGNLTSVSSAISIAGGTNAVVGSGTQIALNPSLIILSSLGGDLSVNQIDTTDATSGQVLRFDGSNLNYWTPDYTSITPGAPGDILYYNGSNYVPATPRRFIQVINSGNTITTPHVPISTLITDVYINGILQEEGVDYTQLGNLFTFAITFNTNNKVIIKYYT